MRGLQRLKTTVMIVEQDQPPARLPHCSCDVTSLLIAIVLMWKPASRLCVFLVVALPVMPGFAQPSFERHIQPLLENLCYDCHGDGANEGGMQLDAHDSLEQLVADQRLWGKVWDNVLTETMPPADAGQPSADERKLLSNWIAETVFRYNPAAPDPGRVTIRRLNREEYRYSVLDLLGIDFPVYEHFPADDTGYGFDTIGDVLTIPPPLLGKYFSAAEWIVERLLTEAAKKNSAVYRQVFFSGDPPTDFEGKLEYARQILERLALRAFRKPVNQTTVEKMLSIVRVALQKDQTTFSEAVGRAVVAVLVSPQFLYRAEFQQKENDSYTVYPLDDFALASRLSYFLWSSIPDQQLFDLAAKGRLRAELSAQVKRMLKDPKSDRFARNFVGQWLRTREVEGVHKKKEFRNIVNKLRPSMRRETEMFFAHIMRNDRDVIEIVTGNYTFLDQRLANYYGIAGVEGKKMRLVNLSPESPRGGVLTQGSILLVTSNPDRTSPVKRGRFILDNILGTPSPPAPPDVPDLQDASRGIDRPLSLREQLALHREDPLCASCHDRMDPLGLGLENFDAIGRWRDSERGLPIDAGGELVSGEEFSGIRELRKVLGNKRRLFYRCLTRKLMIYSLGRGIEYTDTPTIESIVDTMMDNEGRFSTMLLGIVQSPQFLLRRGNQSN